VSVSTQWLGILWIIGRVLFSFTYLRSPTLVVTFPYEFVTFLLADRFGCSEKAEKSSNSNRYTLGY
jgi:uncharacterized MAPEG superfamily protein